MQYQAPKELVLEKNLDYKEDYDISFVHSEGMAIRNKSSLSLLRQKRDHSQDTDSKKKNQKLFNST